MAVKILYRVRWGHERTRAIKGHPKRQERRERAAARQAIEQARPLNDPRRRAVRLGRWSYPKAAA